MEKDLCLTVLKYSYATGVRSDNSIPWSHLQASNIFAVLRGEDTHIRDGKLSMRIVQGNTVLESVDVASYVDAAVEARRGAEQVGVTPQIEQLPIFGITKDSLLAIRYRLKNGQARRLQLRFESRESCEQVFHAFVRRGMEFQEQRLHTSCSSITRLATDSAQRVPLGPIAISPYFERENAPDRPATSRYLATEAGSLSNRVFVSPKQPTTQHNADLQARETRSQQMAPSRTFAKDEATASRECTPLCLATAQMCRSYTTPSQQPSIQTGRETLRQPSDLMLGRPSPNTHIQTLKVTHEADTKSWPRSASAMPPPSLCREQMNETHSSIMTEPTSTALLSSDPQAPHPQSSCPSTAATTLFAETLEHEIPPRRELPFNRPPSRCSGTRSRPGSSALTLPPLPKPKLLKEVRDLTTRKGADSLAQNTIVPRPGTAMSLKRKVDIADDESAPAPSKSAFNMNKFASLESAARWESRVDEPLHGRKALAERPINTEASHLANLNAAPRRLVSPAACFKQPETSLERPLSREIVAAGEHDPTINAYAALTRTGSNLREASLEEYSSQSLQDRQAALDEFMIENLENPHFTTLCEDVENCWRRIALGL